MNDIKPAEEPKPSITLPKDWYVRVSHPGVSDNEPGIYQWDIEGVGSYIGKYSRISRPTKEYGQNVQRILNDRPYHNGGEFRHIHKQLAIAHRDGIRITLTILENVSVVDLNRRERELIAERGSLNVPAYGRRSPSPGRVGFSAPNS